MIPPLVLPLRIPATILIIRMKILVIPLKRIERRVGAEIRVQRERNRRFDLKCRIMTITLPITLLIK